MAYKDLVPVGSSLIIAAASFGLGCVYGNLPYDLETLFRYDPTGANFERALVHYKVWANTPSYVHYIFHFVAILGLSGCFIKLYKPDNDQVYFEYGTLGLLMISLIIYLTNLRTGLNSAHFGDWGEVDMPTGISVMAASQVMIVLALVGALLLQAGLYYAQWYDAGVREKFLKDQADLQAKHSEITKEAKEKVTKETKETKKTASKEKTPKKAAKASGASTAETTTKKKTKK